MKKSVLAIALATATISLALPGEVNATNNPTEQIKESIILGPATGGGGTGAMYLNGIKFQGIKFQGTTLQATKLQGMEVQKLKVEGGQLVAVTRVAADMQGTMSLRCDIYSYNCKKQKK